MFKSVVKPDLKQDITAMKAISSVRPCRLTPGAPRDSDFMCTIELPNSYPTKSQTGPKVSVTGK